MALESLPTEKAVEAVLELALCTDRIVRLSGSERERAEYLTRRDEALKAAQTADGYLRAGMSVLRNGCVPPSLIRRHGESLPVADTTEDDLPDAA